MIILRQRLYSAEEEGPILLYGAGGLMAASRAANEAFGDSLVKRMKKTAGHAQNPELYEKLVQLANKDGIPVEPVRQSMNDVLNGGAIKYAFDPIDKKIYVGMDKDASILAHENGHSRYHIKENESKLGRWLHRVRKSSALFDTKTAKALPNFPGIGAAMVGGAGLASGIADGASGEGSVLGWVTPGVAALASSAPMIGSEIYASRRGYRQLKNLGASKEYLKQARKNYKAAIGTYATGDLVPKLAIGYGARGLGEMISGGAS